MDDVIDGGCRSEKDNEANQVKGNLIKPIPKLKSALTL